MKLKDFIKLFNDLEEGQTPNELWEQYMLINVVDENGEMCGQAIVPRCTPYYYLDSITTDELKLLMEKM